MRVFMFKKVPVLHEDHKKKQIKNNNRMCNKGNVKINRKEIFLYNMTVYYSYY